MTTNKNIRYWIILLSFLILVLVGHNYVYQGHRNIETEKPDYTTSSIILSHEFLNNSIESEKKYLNRAIVVSGIISEINQNNLTLNDNVFCQFNNAINQPLKVKSEIEIKGRVIGYDDLLEQIKLDQCIIK